MVTALAAVTAPRLPDIEPSRQRMSLYSLADHLLCAAPVPRTGMMGLTPVSSATVRSRLHQLTGDSR